MKREGTSLKAVILVGGEGTRLHPLTYEIPKPMVPVINRPFLEHTIAYLKKFQVGDITLAGSYLPEVIRGYFGDGRNLEARLTYTVEDKPLGTAGAVKNAEQYLNSTFAVLNGDIFTDLNLADMLAFHRDKGAKVTIALIWVDNPCAFGVVETDGNNRVTRFVEKPGPDQVTTHWINAGIYILEPEVMEHVPAGSRYMFERGLFQFLLERGEPVYGYPFSGYWLDMGTPEKYFGLNCDLLLSNASSALVGSLSREEVRCGDNAIIHPSAEIVGPVVVGKGCKIGREAFVKGPVVIGPDCRIGEGASIEAAILWRGVNVGANVNLRQCIISDNTKIRDNDQAIKRVVTPEHMSIIHDMEQS